MERLQPVKLAKTLRKKTVGTNTDSIDNDNTFDHNYFKMDPDILADWAYPGRKTVPVPDQETSTSGQLLQPERASVAGVGAAAAVPEDPLPNRKPTIGETAIGYINKKQYGLAVKVLVSRSRMGRREFIKIMQTEIRRQYLNYKKLQPSVLKQKVSSETLEQFTWDQAMDELTTHMPLLMSALEAVMTKRTKRSAGAINMHPDGTYGRCVPVLVMLMSAALSQRNKTSFMFFRGLCSAYMMLHKSSKKVKSWMWKLGVSKCDTVQMERSLEREYIAKGSTWHKGQMRLRMHLNHLMSNTPTHYPNEDEVNAAEAGEGMNEDMDVENGEGSRLSSGSQEQLGSIEEDESDDTSDADDQENTEDISPADLTRQLYEKWFGKKVPDPPAEKSTKKSKGKVKHRKKKKADVHPVPTSDETSNSTAVQEEEDYHMIKYDSNSDSEVCENVASGNKRRRPEKLPKHKKGVKHKRKKKVHSTPIIEETFSTVVQEEEDLIKHDNDSEDSENVAFVIKGHSPEKLPRKYLGRQGSSDQRPQMEAPMEEDAEASENISLLTQRWLVEESGGRVEDVVSRSFEQEQWLNMQTASFTEVPPRDIFSQSFTEEEQHMLPEDNG